jgi:GDPmannose 4,6-dehydratase
MASNPTLIGQTGRESRTQSFAIGIAKIYLGMGTVIMIGNPLTRRDWGHARDLARNLWLIAQESEGDDFICAANNPHSIQDFLDCGFAGVGIQLR